MWSATTSSGMAQAPPWTSNTGSTAKCDLPVRDRLTRRGKPESITEGMALGISLSSGFVIQLWRYEKQAARSFVEFRCGTRILQRLRLCAGQTGHQEDR